MKIIKCLTLFLIFFFLLLPIKSPAAAASLQPSWQAIGQVGGIVGAVYAQGDQVYLGVGQRLVILNGSDPASPREIGASRPLATPLEGIAVTDNLAYITNGGGGLQVVDFSNLDAPQATPTSAPSGIRVCGVSFGMVITAGWIWVKRQRKTIRI